MTTDENNPYTPPKGDSGDPPRTAWDTFWNKAVMFAPFMAFLLFLIMVGLIRLFA